MLLVLEEVTTHIAGFLRPNWTSSKWPCLKSHQSEMPGSGVLSLGYFLLHLMSFIWLIVGHRDCQEQP